jgi:hypothetical protein
MGSSSTPAATTTEGTIPTNDPAYDLRNHHLANQSIHLILILSNHFTNDVHRNPYRLALLHFTDTQGERINVFFKKLTCRIFQIVQQIYPIQNHYLGFQLIIVVYMTYSVKQYILIKVHYYFICYYIVINISKLTLYHGQILIKL